MGDASHVDGLTTVDEFIANGDNEPKWRLRGLGLGLPALKPSGLEEIGSEGITVAGQLE